MVIHSVTYVNVDGSRFQTVIQCCICKRRWFKGSNGHSQCCICKRRGFKCIVVLSILNYNTLIENNIVIPPGARCLHGHIYTDNFNEEAVHNITDLNTETLFNKTEI